MLQTGLLKQKSAAQERVFPAERKAIITQLKTLLPREGTQLAQAEIWLSMAAIAEAEKGAEAAKSEIDGYLSTVMVLL